MTTSSTPPPAFQRFRALLASRRRKATLGHACYTDMVTAVALRVRVPTEALGASALAKCTTTPRVQRLFEKHFGKDLAIKIRDGNQTVWQGAVRLAGIELPRPDGDHVPVTLAFAAPLGDDELVALGLITPPAPEPEPQPEPVVEPDVVAEPEPVVEPVPEDEPRPDENRGDENSGDENRGDENRREAERLQVQVPLAVHTTRGPVEAEIRDVSRTGLRFRVPATALGFEPTRDLSEIAVGVAAVLQETFEADLNHAMVGSLLQKRVHLVRIGVARDTHECIEICGRFDTPLLLEETTMLGVPLPPPSGSDEAWDPDQTVVGPTARKVVLPERPRPQAQRPKPEPTPDEHRPERADAITPAPPTFEDGGEDETLGFTTTRRFRAYVRSSAPDGCQPLSCQTDLVGYEGVRLRMPRPPEASGGLAQAAAAFREAYGAEPNLKLMDRADHLWTGAVRMVAIDLPTEAPDEMLVTLAFLHALRPAEVRRLKLPAAIT